MNEFYALLIVGVLTSALVVLILLSQDSSTDIHTIKNFTKYVSLF
jgi:hypothetical protein